MNQIGNRFRLGEVEFAGEESPPRELTGLGRATTTREAIFDEPTDEKGVAVTRDFQRIITGEGMRGDGQYGDHLIDRRAHEVAPDRRRRAASGGGGATAEGCAGNGRCQGAIDTDYREGGASGGRGGGDDGLGVGHAVGSSQGGGAGEASGVISVEKAGRAGG